MSLVALVLGEESANGFRCCMSHGLLFFDSSLDGRLDVKVKAVQITVAEDERHGATSFK
jgi:hypothetical protein